MTGVYYADSPRYFFILYFLINKASKVLKKEQESALLGPENQVHFQT
ncbi:hypothetical protein GTPT_0528 [Tatumella ptyseos ATCC 33301]|uniref:Uncharacterized protein n=1 Tax=Tatumella ptyseos ATCC 33301 TaxID=1005995 RepID=A0A085JPF8_9GAMM|nr:hypothetical protein GTPT_0528 [Tatumella ptyseos ATCC 33301]